MKAEGAGLSGEHSFVVGNSGGSNGSDDCEKLTSLDQKRRRRQSIAKSTFFLCPDGSLGPWPVVTVPVPVTGPESSRSRVLRETIQSLAGDPPEGLSLRPVTDGSRRVVNRCRFDLASVFGVHVTGLS